MQEYSEDDFKSLYKFIIGLCQLVGVTEAPDKEITLLLLEHIKEHHADFSDGEIRYAFSLATAGKLNFEFNHYNKMTPQLISQTLSSYKELRNQDLLIFNRKVDKIESIERSESEIPSEEEMQKRYIESSLFLFEVYEKYKEDKSSVLIPPVDMGNIVYKFLDRINVIDYDLPSKEAFYSEALKQEVEVMKRKRHSENEIEEFIKSSNKAVNVDVARRAMKNALWSSFDDFMELKNPLKILIKRALKKKF